MLRWLGYRVAAMLMIFFINMVVFALSSYLVQFRYGVDRGDADKVVYKWSVWVNGLICLFALVHLLGGWLAAR